MAGTGKEHLREADPILKIEDLTVEFKTGRAVIQAVAGISLDVIKGETLGIVGESGCGKSTLAKAIVRLNPIKQGAITFAGEDISRLKESKFRRYRLQLQMIFQDPISSLNPLRKVKDIVAEPLQIWSIGDREEREKKVDQMLIDVGLDPEVVKNRRPGQFSGGQCQRISIARALMSAPELLICDEPVSALDVSVQAQILNLLEDLKARRNLTLIFIAHDLGVIKNVSDRVIVMYMGKLCEVTSCEQLFARPLHPYTQALIDAIPKPDPELEKKSLRLPGEIPSPANPPSGCRFRTRCPRAIAKCAEIEPVIEELDTGHFVACHNPTNFFGD